MVFAECVFSSTGELPNPYLPSRQDWESKLLTKRINFLRSAGLQAMTVGMTIE